MLQRELQTGQHQHPRQVVGSRPGRRGSQLRACCLGYDHKLGELRLEGPRPVRHCKTQAHLGPDKMPHEMLELGQCQQRARQGGRGMKVENCRARHWDRLANVATLEPHLEPPSGELGAWPRRTPISPFEDMDPLPWALPVSPSPGPQSLTLQIGELCFLQQPPWTRCRRGRPVQVRI